MTPDDAPRPQLLLLSAPDADALERSTAELASYLASHPEVDLADVAFTLETGERLAHRRAVVCRDPADAAEALGAVDPKRVRDRVDDGDGPPPLAFMFSGQGAQYPSTAARRS